MYNRLITYTVISHTFGSMAGDTDFPRNKTGATDNAHIL